MTFSGQALLVTDARNKSVLPLVIEGLFSCCGVSEVVIVCPENDIHEVEPATEKHSRILLLHDTDVLDIGVQNISTRSIPGFPQRAGWFFQQFLKLGFAYHPKAKANYLIWDADTVPLRPMTFISNNKVLFTRGLEYFPAYFSTIDHLLGFKSSLRCSVISQHCLCVTDIVKSLGSLIQSNCKSSCMVSSILDSCEARSSGFFSEYETYAGYYTHLRPTGFEVIRRRWFRNAAAIVGIPPSRFSLRFLRSFFDYAAFEVWDVGPTRALKASIKLAGSMLRYPS